MKYVLDRSRSCAICTRTGSRAVESVHGPVPDLRDMYTTSPGPSESVHDRSRTFGISTRPVPELRNQYMTGPGPSGYVNDYSPGPSE